MAFDFFVLQTLVSELKEAISGRRIDSVNLSEPNDMVLGISGGNALTISASPQFGRVHLGHTFPWETRSARGAWERMIGSSITDIRQSGMDRIIEIELVKGDRISVILRGLLLVELMGRNSNIILIESVSRKIVALARKVTPEMSRKRVLVPGRIYLPPPPKDWVDPFRDNPNKLGQLLLAQPDLTLEKALSGSVAGLGRIGAKEVAFRAGINAEIKSDELTGAEISRIWNEVSAVYGSFDPKDAPGYLIVDPSGKLIDFSVIDPSWISPDMKRKESSVNEVLRSFFKARIEAHLEEDLRRKLSRVLSKIESGLSRKVESLEEELSLSEKAGDFRKKGEILMANLGNIAKGSKRVALHDLYNPEKEVEIELDPALSPTENASSYFRRYRKAASGSDAIRDQLELAIKELELRRSQLSDIGKLSLEELKSLKPEMLPERETGHGGGSSRGKPGAPRPRRYSTSDGWTVLVGRNNSENDELTRHIAASDDIWFHAYGYPGAHVVLRREGRREGPSTRTIEEVAGLAAYWSKARGSKTVPVTYTEARYVRKPKGTKPGAVTVTGGKTVFVEPKLLEQGKNL